MKEVKERLSKVEGRLDNVEQKLDKVEGRLYKAEQKIDEVDKRLTTRIDELEKNLKQEIEYLRLDMNHKYDDLRDAIFYLETSLGGKLDAICDFIDMQNEKNDDNKDKFSDFSEKIQYNEFKILNHEQRITFLEKKLNRAN